MPHNDINSGSTSSSSPLCTSHMVDPTNLGTPNPVVFKLCTVTSGATDWSLEIRKDVSPYPLVTGCSWPKRAVAQSTFSCSITQTGPYRAIIKYWVNSSSFTHIDKRFVR
jgi:hypothetical protein